MQLCVDHSDIFSTCVKKQYTAVLVDSLGHIVGIGYNGGPKGFKHCDKGGCPRALQNVPSGSSYDNCIAIHAEQNALLHSDYSSNPKKMYVNGPPCFTCAKLIANSTVEKVFYMKDDSYEDWENIKSFLNKAGVETIMVDLNGSW